MLEMGGIRDSVGGGKDEVRVRVRDNAGDGRDKVRARDNAGDGVGAGDRS